VSQEITHLLERIAFDEAAFFSSDEG